MGGGGKARYRMKKVESLRLTRTSQNPYSGRLVVNVRRTRRAPRVVVVVVVGVEPKLRLAGGKNETTRAKFIHEVGPMRERQFDSKCVCVVGRLDARKAATQMASCTLAPVTHDLPKTFSFEERLNCPFHDRFIHPFRRSRMHHGDGQFLASEQQTATHSCVRLFVDRSY